MQLKLTRLDELESLRAQLESEMREHEPFAGFPSEERDSVLASWGTISELRSRLEKTRAGVEDRRQRLEQLEAKREELAQREMQISHLQTYPVDRRQEVERLLLSWRSADAVYREAQRRLETAEAGALGILEEYAELEPVAGELTQADLQVLTSRLRTQVKERSNPFRAAGAAALAAVGAVARLLAQAARLLLRRKQRVSETRTIDSSEPGRFASMPADEAAALLVKHRRFLEIAPLVRTHRLETAAAQRARTAVEDALDRAGDALRPLVKDITDVEAAYAAFQERCAGRNELESVIRRRESVEREAQSLRDAVAASDDDAQRLSIAEQRFRQQLETAV
ncbi:MAG: hypothetical protein ACREU7_15820, partial [Burkholderiales bacterium]